MTDLAARHDPMLRLAISCLLFFLLLLALVSMPQLRDDVRDAATVRAYALSDYPAFDVEDAQRLAYTPFDNLLTIGNSQRTVWLRLEIAPAQEPLVLQVLPAYLREVTLFQRSTDGRWLAQQAGLRHPFNVRALQTFNIDFPLTTVAEGRPSTVYVMVRSPTASLDVRVIPLRAALQHDALLGAVIGLTLGLTLIMLMLCLTAWVVTGDALWGFSVLVDLSSLLFSAIQFGFVARYVLPDAAGLLDHVYPLAFSLLVLAVCGFYGRLMRLFHISGIWLMPYRAGIWMIPVWAYFWLSGRHDLYLQVTNVFLLCLALWGMLLVVLARHDNFWMLVLFRSLLVFSNVMTLIWIIALVFRFSLPDFMVFYAILPHSLITLFIVLLLLGYNTLLQIREKLALQVTQQETSRRLVEEQDRFAESTSFLSLILHEVRNPLNHIRLAVGNLLHELSDDGQQRRLRRISASVTLIDDVLQRSLEVDNIDHGVLPIRKAEADVAGLLRGFIDEHPQASRVQAVLPGVLVANVDADLLLMAIRNLVDNALKYSPPADRIRVILSSAADGFSLQVRNPPGMAGFPSPERLFRKYYRADGAMTQPGMGLGLYWVSSVLPRLGGRIAYVAEQGEVVFTVWLPR